jgi:hypothetical protein
VNGKTPLSRRAHNEIWDEEDHLGNLKRWIKKGDEKFEALNRELSK